MRAVSPQEGDQKAVKHMKVVYEMFTGVFGESVEETLRETGEEANGTRAGTAEAVPSTKELEGHWITARSGAGVRTA